MAKFLKLLQGLTLRGGLILALSPFLDITETAVWSFSNFDVCNGLVNIIKINSSVLLYFSRFLELVTSLISTS